MQVLHPGRFLFVGVVALGVVGTWRFLNLPEKQEPVSSVLEAKQANLTREVSKLDRKESLNIDSVDTQSHSEDIVSMQGWQQSCDPADTSLCTWLSVLSEKAKVGHASSQAILDWLAQYWEKVIDENGELDNTALQQLEKTMKTALLQDETTLSEYRAKVAKWLDKDIANADLNQLKQEMKSMDKDIMTMKLQGMTDAEADLLRMRLFADNKEL